MSKLQGLPNFPAVLSDVMAEKVNSLSQCFEVTRIARIHYRLRSYGDILLIVCASAHFCCVLYSDVVFARILNVPVYSDLLHNTARILNVPVYSDLLHNIARILNVPVYSDLLHNINLQDLYHSAVIFSLKQTLLLFVNDVVTFYNTTHYSRMFESLIGYRLL